MLPDGTKVVDHTDTDGKEMQAKTGFKIITSKPVCAIEFLYGFLEGSDLIGNSKNMTICKNTMVHDMIGPA